MRIPMFRRNEHLVSVFARKGKSLPFAKVRGFRIAIDDDKIDSALEAGNEFPGDVITVDSTQDMLGRNGKIILDERDIDTAAFV